jgi:hypothetical protein
MFEGGKMGLFGKKKKENENEITEVYLMTAANSVEADLVEGILRYEGIPYIKHYQQFGDGAQLYLGFTNMGVDIYVSSEDLQKAKDAIQKNMEALPEAEGEAPEDKE